MKRARPIPEQYLELLREYNDSQKRIKVESSPSPGPQSDNVPEDTQETSDEDEWEQIDLDEQEEENEPEVSTSISVSFTKSVKERKKAMPRKLKVAIHCASIVCLLAHTHTRNRWIQLRDVARHLRNILPSIFLRELHPPQRLSPTLKTEKLLDGLRHTVKWWQGKFTILKQGLYMVPWGQFRDQSREVEGPVTLANFIAHMAALKGSTDEYCQGYCALLRANGIECRLVCSLQPPDFMASTGKKSKPSSYPIYWTEVWDPYSNNWITADPLTGCVEVVRRSSPLEPPQNDGRNLLRYVIAWSQDGHARDVTRRYSNKYNARTRKKRVEYMGESYAEWYYKLLAKVAPKTLRKRDIDELKYFQKRQRMEGIPSRVQDFLNHPFYVLEHQLKKNEIIEPKEPCGTLAIRNEVVSIYPRKNVKVCFSAQSWYRRGRIITGAQPKTYRTQKNRLSGELDRVALYSYDQTDVFVPPPVENGIIPKTEYRTIDVFTPEMVPSGAVHFRHKYGQKAAKFLRVDFANAVVRIEFGKLGPKSKYDGIVVAKEYFEAVRDVANEMERMADEDERKRERLRRLQLWKQFIVAAHIRQRVNSMNDGQKDFEIVDDEPWPSSDDSFDESEDEETFDRPQHDEVAEDAQSKPAYEQPRHPAGSGEPSQTMLAPPSLKIPLQDVLYEPDPTSSHDVTGVAKDSPEGDDTDSSFPELAIDSESD